MKHNLTKFERRIKENLIFKILLPSIIVLSIAVVILSDRLLTPVDNNAALTALYIIQQGGGASSYSGNAAAPKFDLTETVNKSLRSATTQSEVRDGDGVDNNLPLNHHQTAAKPTNVRQDCQIPARAAYTQQMIVTAYCPCKICCGKHAQGITASGHKIRKGQKFVAAPRWLPLHSRLTVPGYARDTPVKCLDRGGAIKGNKLDVYFDTHKEAKKWGVRKLNVIINPCLKSK